jgi:hypothetical protein
MAAGIRHGVPYYEAMETIPLSRLDPFGVLFNEATRSRDARHFFLATNPAKRKSPAHVH